ncbi:hypothetical protein NUW54_g1382 [Trametes sanguinea]|uniref:Uncharacterized protein n=1 Tax=Trametes sanguinea TaxID=158606 RepID=A0ACC1Q9G7_9APHY|nr:hypothetical protein NUW54_g1382 [Trametes sanguinea]
MQGYFALKLSDSEVSIHLEWDTALRFPSRVVYFCPHTQQGDICWQAGGVRYDAARDAGTHYISDLGVSPRPSAFQYFSVRHRQVQGPHSYSLAESPCPELVPQKRSLCVPASRFIPLHELPTNDSRTPASNCQPPALPMPKYEVRATASNVYVRRRHYATPLHSDRPEH